MKFNLKEGQMLPKRVIASYIFDYAVIIILIIASVELDRVEPFHQQFSLRNYTLQYSFRLHDRVPRALLWTVAIISPGIVIAIWTLLIDGLFSQKIEGRKRKYTFRQRLWQLNAGLLGLGLAISLQYVIVNTLKNLIGKPRPDLIDRCQPKPGSEDPLPFGLSDYSICTQTNLSILKDGFRSFPSGHSATSFGGLFYLSLFLSAKLHIFDSRGEVWKIFVVLVPTLGAAMVAGTRIIDARHHAFDVISGSLIGLVVAWLSYRQYFPSPKEYHRKGQAFPMRTWTPNGALGERDDIEEGHEGEQRYGYAATDRDEEDVHPEASSSAAGGQSRGNIFRNEVSRSQRQRQRNAARFNPTAENELAPPIPVIMAPGHDRPDEGSYDPVIEMDTSYQRAGAGNGLGVNARQSEIEVR